MKSIYKIVIIILGIIITTAVNAQSLDRQIISNAGEYQESLSYSLNFTIGEPITSYEENGSFKLTQGFQQNSFQDEEEETSIKEKEIIIDYTLFPNPARDFLQLEFSNLEDNILNIEIVNSLGLIQIQELNFQKGSENQKIDISKLSKGKYIIKINNKNNYLLKSINFIKY